MTGGSVVIRTARNLGPAATATARKSWRRSWLKLEIPFCTSSSDTSAGNEMNCSSGKARVYWLLKTALLHANQILPARKSDFRQHPNQISDNPQIRFLAVRESDLAIARTRARLQACRNPTTQEASLAAVVFAHKLKLPPQSAVSALPAHLCFLLQL